MCVCSHCGEGFLVPHARVQASAMLRPNDSSSGFSTAGKEGPLTSSGRSSNKPGSPAALMLGAGPERFDTAKRKAKRTSRTSLSSKDSENGAELWQDYGLRLAKGSQNNQS